MYLYTQVEIILILNFDAQSVDFIQSIIAVEINSNGCCPSCLVNELNKPVSHERFFYLIKFQ